MSDTGYVFTVIVLMAAVTVLLRALPFIAGHWLRRHAFVQKLGDSLPLSIMVLLLVDTVAGQARGHAGLPWQELAAVAVVVALQWRTRQPLLSIVAGTALYVALRAL
jgi:branched-subunit amino acid transport protein AzlD